MSSRQTFSLLCLPALAEMSVDPTFSFAVAANIFCQCVLYLNPEFAMLYAIQPTGMSVSRKPKQTGQRRPFKKLQVYYFFHTHFRSPAGNHSLAEISYWFYIPGGSAAVPAGALCHFPPQTSLAAAESSRTPLCHWALSLPLICSRYQAVLPLPAAAVAS